MATPNPFRIPVADLLKRHGAARPERVSAPLAALCGQGAEVPADRPIDLDLTLERVSDGIVVRGRVHAPWQAACSRCLAPVEGEVSVHVDELFENHPLDGETYLLDHDIIDLEPLVRDALMLDLPTRPSAGTSAQACVPSVAPIATLRRATAAPSNSTPDGRPCGRSTSRSPRSQSMAVPKRKMSRSATRSRKSANMRLTAPAHSLCPNCGASRLPHRVCSNCGWYRGRQVLEVE